MQNAEKQECLLLFLYPLKTTFNSFQPRLFLDEVSLIPNARSPKSRGHPQIQRNPRINLFEKEAQSNFLS